VISARTERPGRLGGTVGNELLTSATALVLTALLLAEGVTIPWIGGLLTEHMFIGLLLIPPVALKLASTGYRFVRYYAGSARYRTKGPPPLALRALAPLLVLTTVLIFVTGVWLLLLGHKSDVVLELHKVSFIVWSVLFGVHFLWHVPHVWTALASRHRMRRPAGAALRGFALAASLGGGAVLALALLSLIEGWQRWPFGVPH
jgi:hypothetical protein